MNGPSGTNLLQGLETYFNSLEKEIATAFCDRIDTDVILNSKKREEKAVDEEIAARHPIKRMRENNDGVDTVNQWARQAFDQLFSNLTPNNSQVVHADMQWKTFLYVLEQTLILSVNIDQQSQDQKIDKQNS